LEALRGGRAARAVWQALPANRDSEAARRLGWPLGLAALFNCLWMLFSIKTECQVRESHLTL
jgi:hypothetical protein